jgi:hypothetical protein
MNVTAFGLRSPAGLARLSQMWGAQNLTVLPVAVAPRTSHSHQASILVAVAHFEMAALRRRSGPCVQYCVRTGGGAPDVADAPGEDSCRSTVRAFAGGAIVIVAHGQPPKDSGKLGLNHHLENDSQSRMAQGLSSGKHRFRWTEPGLTRTFD